MATNLNAVAISYTQQAENPIPPDVIAGIGIITVHRDGRTQRVEGLSMTEAMPKPSVYGK